MNRLFGTALEPDEEVPLIATADEQIRPQIVQIFALVGEAMAGPRTRSSRATANWPSASSTRTSPSTTW